MSALQQYLYRIQPTRPEMLAEGPTDDERAAVGRHAAYVKGLTERGVVLLAGRTQNTDPSALGIVIFRAASEPVAREIMNDDPAVKEGVMRAELFPYRIAFAAERWPTGD
jgi:uncharacterized protein YciI